MHIYVCRSLATKIEKYILLTAFRALQIPTGTTDSPDHHPTFAISQNSPGNGRRQLKLAFTKG